MAESLHLIRGTVAQVDELLPPVALNVDRLVLAKRLWRGTADDGVEFGFQLVAPLKHGDVIHQTDLVRYVVHQREEPVVEISLDVTPAAAAGIGWAIGNLHLELSAEPTRLLAPDEPAVRQLLTRLNVPYRSTIAIFRPGRFARGAHSTHEFGASHKHNGGAA